MNNRSNLLDLGRNILIIRKALKINHEKLVELSGITRPILSGIENFTANPRMSSLISLQQSLNISIEMMFLSKSMFKKYQNLLKFSYKREKKEEYDILIDEKSWKQLIKYSGSEERKSINSVSTLVGDVIRANFNHIDEKYLPNMMLGASLGVIFQEDGFKYGLEFGAWLGFSLGGK